MTELSDKFMRKTAEETVEKICNGIYSDDDLIPLTDFLSPEQKTNFYLICSELESTIISQEHSIDKLWEGGDTALRGNIKNARIRIKRQAEAITLLCKFTQSISDHSLRGSIRYLNKFIETSDKL